MDDERATLLAELDAITAELARLDTAGGELLERRQRLLRAARLLVPPVTHRELAEHAGITEERVIQVVDASGVMAKRKEAKDQARAAKASAP